MPNLTINRRKALQLIGITAGASVLTNADASISGIKNPANPTFTYCLNMATIRGHNLGFVKELQTASKAGFHSVEIWIDTLQTYLSKGGTIADVKKMLVDLDIKVENDISFTQWIVDDEAIRKNALEQMKREMDMMAELGCKRI